MGSQRRLRRGGIEGDFGHPEGRPRALAMVAVWTGASAALTPKCATTDVGAPLQTNRRLTAIPAWSTGIRRPGMAVTIHVLVSQIPPFPWHSLPGQALAE